MSYILLKQIGTMFLIILMGALSYKIGLISKNGNRDISNIILYLTNPIVIATAYLQEFTIQKLKMFLLFGVISILSYLVLIPVINCMISRKGKEYAIDRFSAIYGNAGFFGIPIISSLFGSEGVFYLTAYLTVFNIFVWSHGYMLMQSEDQRVAEESKSIVGILKEAMVSMVNPTIMAAVVGFLLFIFRVTLPEVILNGFTYIGNMNTPLAMMVAGIALAQTNLKEIIFNRRVYYVAFLKLLLSPLLTIAAMKIFALPEMLTMILIIINGCPTAATGTMFAIKCGKNDAYASSLYVITTLMSLITLPLIMLLY